MTTTTLPVAPGPETPGAIRTHAGNYIIPASTDGHMSCRDCGRTLPVTKFPTLPARADGIVRRQPRDNAQCRACRDARNTARKTGGTFIITGGIPGVAYPVAADSTIAGIPTIGRDANGRPFRHTPSYVGYVPDATAPVPSTVPYGDRMAARWASGTMSDHLFTVAESARATDTAMAAAMATTATGTAA